MTLLLSFIFLNIKIYTCQLKEDYRKVAFVLPVLKEQLVYLDSS